VATDAYNWSEHWSAYDTNTQFNPAQMFRFRLILRELKSLPGKSLVDIGCGQGDLLRQISTKVPALKLSGFELSPSGVALAKQKVPTAQVEELDLYSDDAVDRLKGVGAELATCSEVLEHVPDPITFLKRASQALCPSGYLVATVPGGPRTAFDRQIGHLRHFDVRSIREVFEAAGLEVQFVRGSGFPFFNLYKLAVLMRGGKVSTDYRGDASLVFRTAMKIFDALFRLNVNKSRFGWHILIVARRPALPA